MEQFVAGSSYEYEPKLYVGYDVICDDPLFWCPDCRVVFNFIYL